MSEDRKYSQSPKSPDLVGRDQTPSPLGLRHRPPTRTATFNTKDGDGLNRRPSIFSESFSDTHRSFRTSTDNLLLPRVQTTSDEDDRIETSHWHSVPLGLALLPAVGGLLFKDGSALITDVTLLCLAAIFLNWALRLPWEWYKAAQATVTVDLEPQTPFSSIDEEEDENSEVKPNGDLPKVRATMNVENSYNEELQAAQKELRLHEFLALVACFIFPVLGAWLLHAIRSQLSRPSEGLVSNYNLTIFLLVAEIRPLSHMIKLIQRRTLFLQRKVNSRVLQEQQIEEKQDVTEITKRLEELEAYVASAAAASEASETSHNIPPSEALVSQATAQASNELRKAFQPELDALNRAMRRYEKRMTITAIQVESRLQDLETRLKDVVSLAAAAQRNADKRPRNYLSILTNWLCAFIVIPAQYVYHLLSLPRRAAHGLLAWVRSLLHLNRRVEIKDGKASNRQSIPKSRGPQKKNKPSA